MTGTPPPILWPPSTRTLLLIGLPSLVIAAVVIGGVLWMSGDVEKQDLVLATSIPLPMSRYFIANPDKSQLDIVVDSRMGDIEGSFRLARGTVELSPETGGWRVIVNLILDAGTLSMGNEALDSVMAHALELDKYPEGAFIAHSDDMASELNPPFDVTLRGEIELHGVVKDYEIPTRVTLEGDTLTLAAHVIIDAAEFGVEIPLGFADEKLDTELVVVAYEGAPPAESIPTGDTPAESTPTPTPDSGE
ncbi:MAG: YceI family protein [Anaerolineae bacterium]|nr:YceI family protein [Anaerolineae bacterium]